MNTEELYYSIRPRYPELNGQVAVVTGSSRGIGKGIALRLAREGMRVVISGINAEEVFTTAEELEKLDVTVFALPGDLSLPEEIDRLFAETLKRFGTVDLLVNNAALLDRRAFLETNEASLDRQLALNIKSPFLCAYRAAEIMSQKEQGNIISISSVGGVRAHWQGLPYDMTKGAVDALTRALALDLAQSNIRVNAIAPGAIWTEKRDAKDEVNSPDIEGRIPLKRFGLPLEIGSAVAFLASPDAEYITGQILYVDGGITAQLSPPGQPI